MTIKIETGVPIPVITRPRISDTKYPFAELKINESFSVPYGEDAPHRVETRLRAAVYRAQRALGLRFTMRIYDDGVRIWRTA